MQLLNFPLGFKFSGITESRHSGLLQDRNEHNLVVCKQLYACQGSPPPAFAHPDATSCLPGSAVSLGVV